MKFIYAVLTTALLLESNVSAANFQTEEGNCINKVVNELKETDVDADKIINGAKETCGELSAEISEELKDASKQVVEKTSESVKKSILESVENYFSTMFTRIKEFFSNVFSI